MKRIQLNIAWYQESFFSFKRQESVFRELNNEFGMLEKNLFSWSITGFEDKIHQNLSSTPRSLPVEWTSIIQPHSPEISILPSPTNGQSTLATESFFSLSMNCSFSNQITKTPEKR
jgi:hypothetical protein